MSADNIVYVQKKKKYHVWHDFASNQTPSYKNQSTHKKFDDQLEAYKYAHELSDKWETEYGVKVLPPIDTCKCGDNCQCQK